jgi:hypothetical protein
MSTITMKAPTLNAALTVLLPAGFLGANAV